MKHFQAQNVYNTRIKFYGRNVMNIKIQEVKETVKFLFSSK